ncbi:MarR family winged helix-turn-helix transcriptional regulator [Millisia brevis]|uniref:MarR family winged helix-turn-helix transcriptional regulator n=1 Tax=Millisia brevis TaxID=264148 RepID=UPI000835B79E|nr:MarR family transcriptional regulator [Millisia brevis]
MARTSTEIGRELRSLLVPLRRAVTRAAPAPTRAGGLSDAQIELLRCLQAGGQMTTNEVAQRLHLARPTVSNLVKGLATAGMVERELSPHDSRMVLISLSSAARQILSDVDTGRAAAMQRAIDGLDEPERAAIEAALPALGRLLTLLRADSRHHDEEEDGDE